jgi:hypothetical protein
LEDAQTARNMQMEIGMSKKWALNVQVFCKKTIYKQATLFKAEANPSRKHVY